MLIPKFSWWYYKSIADEVNGHTLQYPLYEDGNTFKYGIQCMILKMILSRLTLTEIG